MDDNCREVLTQLQTFLDGECPGDLEAVVVEHLHDCSPCLGRAEFERELRSIIARTCRESAPARLVHRVLTDLSLHTE